MTSSNFEKSSAVFAQSDPVEKSARTLLEAKCYTCHGAARMSGLDLRDRATILTGGKRGPAVIPGKADESLLYRAVRREGNLQMPPGKGALTAAEVKTSEITHAQVVELITAGRTGDIGLKPAEAAQSA